MRQFMVRSREDLYFIINIDNGYLRLIDNYITESISVAIDSYKIDNDRLLMNIENPLIC